jgi:prepilin-type N-terminal cleavage/methylation domain-containing protein
MRRRAGGRGFTLIEGMVAMTVMLVGALGMIGLYNQGQRLHGDSRRMTRATAVALDLLNQIELWPYSETAGPLVNANTTNDGDIGDAAQAFEADGTPPADHGEADLPADWRGIPAADLSNEYERYWNVAYVDDTNQNGVWDGVRIAVVVRWRHGAGWRRVVLLAVKPNPVER